MVDTSFPRHGAPPFGVKPCRVTCSPCLRTGVNHVPGLYTLFGGRGNYEAVDVELHAGQTVACLMRAGLKPLAFGVPTCIHGRRVRLLPRLATCARDGEDWDGGIPCRRLVAHVYSVTP